MPGFHHCVALPFPYTVAVATAVCLGSSASMIGWPGTERNKRKIELDRISTVERLRQLFAVYGCNETFCKNYVRKLQRNFTAVYERRNGNGRTATEWWITGYLHVL